MGTIAAGILTYTIGKIIGLVVMGIIEIRRVLVLRSGIYDLIHKNLQEQAVLEHDAATKVAEAIRTGSWKTYGENNSWGWDSHEDFFRRVRWF